MNDKNNQLAKKELFSRWESFVEQNTKMRIRDVAKALEVSELELVALHDGERNQGLTNDFEAIFNELQAFNILLGITRNDYVVHESRAQYLDFKKHGNVGICLEPGMDCRFFFDEWEYVFAVNENDRYSIQFFDQYGVAAHKVYMTDDTDISLYHALVEKFKPPQTTPLNITKCPPQREAVKLDQQKLTQAWSEIQDLHEASRLIRNIANGDHQMVYRALGEEYAKRLKAEAVETILEAFAKTDLRSTIFVIGDSAVQAYSGVIDKTLRTGPWFNILDADFNLHLKSQAVASAWLIKKASKNGWINTVEAFDADGNQLLIIAANRSCDSGQAQEWTLALNKITDGLLIEADQTQP